jgi:hypothetical protein
LTLSPDHINKEEKPGPASETEAVLDDIMASYWQVLAEAIQAGDGARIDRYIAFIGHLTGRPQAQVVIPDLPEAIEIRRASS